MFTYKDLVTIKVKSVEEGKALKIEIGEKYYLIEPDIKIEACSQNPSLLFFKQKEPILNKNKDTLTFLNIDSITSISLIPKASDRAKMLKNFR